MAWSRFRKKKEMPEGLWLRCEKCRHMIFRQDMERLLKVCPECGYHFNLSADERIKITLDSNSFHELFADMRAKDNLGFVAKESYVDKLKQLESTTGLSEAAVVGRGKMEGRDVVLGVIDFRFFGGSMGEVVGEKVTRIIEIATEEKIPLIIFSSSGGARMQEGALSLMQLAKTSSALTELDKAGGLFISVLTNPVMGGVMASFASLGDVIYAEPGAIAGFAGPRVIQATLKQELPAGFQTSEFLMAHGFIDRVVKRPEMRQEIIRTMNLLLGKVKGNGQKAEPEGLGAEEGRAGSGPEAADAAAEKAESPADRDKEKS